MRHITHCHRCFSTLIAGEDHLKKDCGAVLRTMLQRRSEQFAELTATLAELTAETDELAEVADGIPLLDHVVNTTDDLTEAEADVLREDLARLHTGPAPVHGIMQLEPEPDVHDG